MATELAFDDLPEMLTVRDYARLSGLAVQTIGYHIRRGVIPAVKAFDGATAPYLIRREDAVAHLARGGRREVRITAA